MNDDKLDSQLSAMFDGELPAAECELLARRLSRDEQLRRRWASYALIGAVLRDEPLPVRQTLAGRPVADLAARVAAAIDAGAGEAAGDASPGVRSVSDGATRAAGAAAWARWVWPLGGVAAAAAVAFVAISLVRVAPQDAGFVADRVAPTAASPGAVPGAVEEEIVIPVAGSSPRLIAQVTPKAATPSGVALDAARPGGSGEPESYVVPVTRAARGAVPNAQLVNYFVAHGEVAAPIARRSAIAALVAGEAVPADVVTDRSGVRAR
ncbi:MAG: sigma-E factor negative regulatory protein [Steroidobacteraceae bacterium]|jgi:negative regulator of sigma E activity